MTRVTTLSAAVIVAAAAAVAVVLVRAGGQNEGKEQSPAAVRRPSRPALESRPTERGAETKAPPPVAQAEVQAPAEAEDVWKGAEAPRRDGPWETIPPVSRFESLGPIGSELRTAMSDLKTQRLEQCFGGTTPDPGSALAAQEEQGTIPDTTPVLLLQLETLDGSVRIDDVAVKAPGSASPRTLDCAVSALRGTTLRIPQATAGSRHRFLYRLAPG